MTGFSAIPSYGEPLVSKNNTSRTWYLFWSDLRNGRPPNAISTIAIGTSPFTYQAQQKGFVIVRGGTVTLIQFTRDQITNVNTGVTSGCIPLSQGDSVIVTFSAPPNMTFVPQ